MHLYTEPGYKFGYIPAVKDARLVHATKVLALGLTEEKKYVLRCMEVGGTSEGQPEELVIEFGMTKLCSQHS